MTLDRPPHRARPAGAREDRRHRRLHRGARPQAGRPRGVRDPRRRLRRGTSAPVGPFAAARSSLPALKGVQTPVFMMQGRRDFAFGLDQALRASRRSPARSSCGSGCTATRRRPASPPTRPRCSPRARAGSTGSCAATRRRRSQARSRSPPSAGRGSRAVRRAAEGRDDARPRSRHEAGDRPGRPVPLPRRRGSARPLEVFGSPVVQVTATATGGWSRIVAVLSARTPAGKEIVVARRRRPDARRASGRTGSASSEPGDVPPRGSRLTVTIGSSSLAQNPGEPPLPRSAVPVDGAAHASPAGR